MSIYNHQDQPVHGPNAPTLYALADRRAPAGPLPTQVDVVAGIKHGRYPRGEFKLWSAHQLAWGSAYILALIETGNLMMPCSQMIARIEGGVSSFATAT